MKKIAGFIFWVLGWKIDETTPVGIKKCVIVVGPHTSNWDFILGRLAFVMYGVNAKFLIKKELFFPPLSWILKALGGLPVDRRKRNNLTETALKYFKETDTMFIVFSRKELEIIILIGKKDSITLRKKLKSQFVLSMLIISKNWRVSQCILSNWGCE